MCGQQLSKMQRHGNVTRDGSYMQVLSLSPCGPVGPVGSAQTLDTPSSGMAYSVPATLAPSCPFSVRGACL